MNDSPSFLLDFSACVDESPSPPAGDERTAERSDVAAAGEPVHFGDEPELPPTWSEHSAIFHTTEKCTRLQAIRRNRRITGNPGLRQHCLNCIDIAATKRRG